MIPRDDEHQLQHVMTVGEIAAVRVSRATIYWLVNSGVLPGMRVGKAVRVTRRVVEEFMRPHPGSAS